MLLFFLFSVPHGRFFFLFSQPRDMTYDTIPALEAW